MDENRADDESDDDRDLPRREDMDDDPEGTPTDDCPHCGKTIVEGAEWCHHCGKYLSEEDAPRHVPLWLVIGAATVALAVTTLLFFSRH